MAGSSSPTRSRSAEAATTPLAHPLPSSGRAASPCTGRGRRTGPDSWRPPACRTRRSPSARSAGGCAPPRPGCGPAAPRCHCRPGSSLADRPWSAAPSPSTPAAATRGWRRLASGAAGRCGVRSRGSPSSRGSPRSARLRRSCDDRKRALPVGLARHTRRGTRAADGEVGNEDLVRGAVESYVGGQEPARLAGGLLSCRSGRGAGALHDWLAEALDGWLAEAGLVGRGFLSRAGASGMDVAAAPLESRLLGSGGGAVPKAAATTAALPAVRCSRMRVAALTGPPSPCVGRRPSASASARRAWGRGCVALSYSTEDIGTA